MKLWAMAFSGGGRRARGSRRGRRGIRGRAVARQCPPFWPPDYEAFVRRLAQGVDYRVFDGVGHFLMLEKPEEFNATVEGFLAKRLG